MFLNIRRFYWILLNPGQNSTMLIVFGGKKDFNIGRLLLYLKQQKIEHLPIVLREDYLPQVLWDMDSDMLLIDGKAIAPSAIYLRQDVFQSSPYSDGLGRSIYSLLRSYALAHPHVLMFNKRYIGMHKAYNLYLAKQFQLEIPKSSISNHLAFLKALPNPDSLIVKPLGGGQYTQTLTDYLSKQNAGEQDMLFVQEKLKQPEMRIYYIGGQTFAFYMNSEKLDYRVDPNVKITVAEAHSDQVQKFKAMCEYLNLSYAAADFKTSSSDSRYKFLEVNSSPMFAAFDKVVDGQICRAITNYLVGV